MTTQYDIDCYIDDAISEGFAKGLEKGKNEARTEAVIKALRRGKLTLEEIAEDNDVSVDRVREIQRGLQRK